MSRKDISKVRNFKCGDCNQGIKAGSLRCRRCAAQSRKSPASEEERRKRHREYMRKYYHSTPERRQKAIDSAKRYRQTEEYKRSWERRRAAADAAHPKVKAPQIRPELVAYAAGIIDGEGSIQIRKTMGRNGEVNPTYEIFISVTNTNPTMIDFLLKHFGGNAFQDRKGTDTHRPTYRWNIVGERGQWFLKIIREFIVCKAEEIDLAMLFRTSFVVRNRNPRIPTSAKVVAFRHDCYTKMKALHNRAWHDHKFDYKRRRTGEHCPLFETVAGT